MSATMILGETPQHLKIPTEKARLKAIISTKFRLNPPIAKYCGF